MGHWIAFCLVLLPVPWLWAALGQQSAEESICAAIHRYVAAAADCPAQEIVVECGVIPAALRQCAVMAETLRVRPQDGTVSLVGKRLFVVEAVRGGVAEGRGLVLATIRRFAEVVVARRRLDRQEPLCVADVGLEWREVKGVRGTPMHRVADVLRKRTRHAIARGQVIRAEDLEVPPVVRRGDLVTLLVETKNLTISMKVQALQDGAGGQRIPVRAPSTNTRYMAEVKEPGLVVVRP